MAFSFLSKATEAVTFQKIMQSVASKGERTLLPTPRSPVILQTIASQGRHGPCLQEASFICSLKITSSQYYLKKQRKKEIKITSSLGLGQKYPWQKSKV